MSVNPAVSEVRAPCASDLAADRGASRPPQSEPFRHGAREGSQPAEAGFSAIDPAVHEEPRSLGDDDPVFFVPPGVHIVLDREVGPRCVG